MSIRIAVAFTGLFLSSGLPAQPAVPSASYRIEWREADFPRAQVTARLRSKDCTFGTSRKWASFFDGDRGWSRFISNFAARDSRGRPLPVRVLPEGRWRVGQRGACEVA